MFLQFLELKGSMNYRVPLLFLCVNTTNILTVPKITKEVIGDETIYRLFSEGGAQSSSQPIIMARQRVFPEAVATACFEYIDDKDVKGKVYKAMRIIDAGYFYELHEEYNKKQD